MIYAVVVPYVRLQAMHVNIHVGVKMLWLCVKDKYIFEQRRQNMEDFCMKYSIKYTNSLFIKHMNKQFLISFIHNYIHVAVNEYGSSLHLLRLDVK